MKINKCFIGVEKKKKLKVYFILFLLSTVCSTTQITVNTNKQDLFFRTSGQSRIVFLSVVVVLNKDSLVFYYH